jgi:hypothetical protein
LRAARPGGNVIPVMARPFALVLAAALLAAPATASARHGGDRDVVRAAGTCGGGVRSELKLKADDGGIETEFEVHQARRGSAWRLTVSQEGRVVWRGKARVGSSSRSFTIERRLRDLPGADRVSVRASGPSGVACRVSATLPGD